MRASISIVVGALLLAAGCTAGVDEADASDEPSASADADTTDVPAALEPAEGCPTPDPALVVAPDDLAGGTVIIATQAISSVQDPGTEELLVRVCSAEGLDGAALLGVAQPIADAVLATDRVFSSLVVSSWAPADDGLQQFGTVRADDLDATGPLDWQPV